MGCENVLFNGWFMEFKKIMWINVKGLRSKGRIDNKEKENKIKKNVRKW